jgi:hypothetical protein
MCKEMPVIPVSRVVDPKRIIIKNGGLRRRRGTATEKSEAIACARRCRSSRLAGWWTQKE